MVCGVATRAFSSLEKQKIFVTFLYELDRSSWSKFQRSFTDYLKKFEALLQALLYDLKSEIVVFGDDPRVEDLCSKFPRCFYYSKPLKSWNVYTTLSRIQKNLDTKRGRFKVPEFFSEDYICLQLIKFEAVQLVCKKEHDNIIWIDAGLHSHLLPNDWTIKWKSPHKIHALQIGPMPWWERWVLETPTVCIAGTCWGGSQRAMSLLCTRVLNLHEECLQKGLVGNDQQYLSIVFNRYPQEFLVKRSFTDFGIYSSQNFNHVVDSVLNESYPENVRNYFLLFLPLLLGSFLLLLFFFSSPPNSAFASSKYLL
jgi:hypothetical protein